jgi:hypothetical protein
MIFPSLDISIYEKVPLNIYAMILRTINRNVWVIVYRQYQFLCGNLHSQKECQQGYVIKQCE